MEEVLFWLEVSTMVDGSGAGGDDVQLNVGDLFAFPGDVGAWGKKSVCTI